MEYSTLDHGLKRTFSTFPFLPIILPRLMVGSVFVSEGMQKFLFSDALGAGRFARIGLPYPEFLGPFVGAVEFTAGILLLFGLLTRPAALSLLVIMSVAIVTTKLPILIGESFWGLQLRDLPRYGLLSMAHEARTDFSMWIGSLFLLITGAGPYSVDSHIAKLLHEKGKKASRHESRQ